MAGALRVGVAGLIHDHVWWNVDAFTRSRRTRIVAAADRNRPLADRLRAIEPGLSIHRDWQRMLDREDLDIVLACTTNAGTAEIVEAGLISADRGRRVPLPLRERLPV
jgi:predicted dehydrogenase